MSSYIVEKEADELETCPEPKEPSVRVVFDVLKNIAFIKEFEEKINFCETEDEKNSLKEEFKKFTSFDFDDALNRVNNNAVQNDDIPLNAINRITVGDDSNSNKVLEEKTQHKEKLTRIDEYIKKPTELQFTKDEIKETLDKVTDKNNEDHIKKIIDNFNNDMTDIENGIHDESSRYYDFETRKKAIYNAVEFKTQMIDILVTGRDMINEANLITERIFQMQYPQYVEFGPAWVLEEFYEYIVRNMEYKEYIDKRCKELNSIKKIKIALYYADNSLFNYIQLYGKNDRKQIDWKIFIQSVFYWNIKRISELTGTEIKNTPEDRDRFSSLLITFLILFIRYCKRSFPDLHKNPSHVALLSKFIVDNANEKYLPPHILKRLDNAWKQIFDKCAFIANTANSRLSNTHHSDKASHVTVSVEEKESLENDDGIEENYTNSPIVPTSITDMSDE